MEPVHVLKGHGGAVLSACFTHDGGYVLSGSVDKTIKLWNPHKGICIKTYKGPHNYEVSSLCVTKDNSRFASAGGDRVAFYWDVGTGQVTRKLVGHDRKLNVVRFNETEEVLLTGGADKTVRIWDLKSHQRAPIQVIDEFKDAVMCMAIHDHEIIVGSIDGSVKTFDVRMGTVNIDEFGMPITSVSLSRDKQCLLASTLENQMFLLEKSTGEQLAVYKGHISKQFRLTSCFDPSDAIVISGSEDGRLCMWDLVKTDTMHAHKVHDGPVLEVAFHEKKQVMLTTSTDQTLKVWRP